MANVDTSKEIRRATDTGKVIFGSKESENSIKNGSAKLIIIANNTPKLVQEKIISFAGVGSTPVFMFEGTGLDLGSVCGKPFPVSIMSIENEGKSKVLEVTKQ